MPPIAAFQMDALDAINPKGDTTLTLMLEAQARGYRIFHYLPSTLAFENGKLTASGHFVQVHDDAAHHYDVLSAETLDLRQVKVVWLRQDPPFDMAYITSTYLLESLAPDVLVVNNPDAVRNCPEKWFVNDFPQYLPPTLVTTHLPAIEDFRKRHGDIIVKPLYGHGGNAVFRLKEDDGNFNALLEFMFKTSPEALVIQKFLPEVKDGDIRVVLVDGEVAGQIGRVPAHGEIRSNLRVGGTAAEISLTPRQWEICDALKQPLKDKGLLLVGIDLIGDYLTEVNVTSPTGIRSINALYGVKVEAQVWDAVEKKLAN
ncbi:MAG: glutathione synthase [Alphaproteobacteria bacterium]|nr:glutathione synthase [Alphaproteobacteria bacterium]